MEQPRRLALTVAAVLLAAATALVAARGAGTGRAPALQAPGRAAPLPDADERILVEVLNGSGRDGLARAATLTLRRAQLDVVYFGGTDQRPDSTLVLVRRGARATGVRVREALGAGQVREAPDSLRRVDVSVILGPDFQPASRARSPRP